MRKFDSIVRTRATPPANLKVFPGWLKLVKHPLHLLHEFGVEQADRSLGIPDCRSPLSGSVEEKGDDVGHPGAVHWKGGGLELKHLGALLQEGVTGAHGSLPGADATLLGFVTGAEDAASSLSCSCCDWADRLFMLAANDSRVLRTAYN